MGTVSDKIDARRTETIPGHNGLNGILWTGRLHDEPEEHVDHVDDPDRGVEVEAVAEHELPVREPLQTERLEGTVHREHEL